MLRVSTLAAASNTEPSRTTSTTVILYVPRGPLVESDTWPLVFVTAFAVCVVPFGKVHRTLTVAPLTAEPVGVRTVAVAVTVAMVRRTLDESDSVDTRITVARATTTSTVVTEVLPAASVAVALSW